MDRRLISYTLILLGAGALLLSLYQANQMLISGAQNDASRAAVDATLEAQKAQASALGSTDAEIAAASQQIKTLTEQSINKQNQALQQSLLIDLVFGVVFVAAGLFVHPRKE